MRLADQSWLSDSKTKRLLAAFAAQNIALRFVGGCVRDAIMGRAVGDIDCATPAAPKITMELLQEAGIKAVPTGIAHGTVTAVIDSTPFEITTLRRDIACDGRHAEVEYTDDWREDASRRDFTMNALYCDAQGTITDYFDGIADAKAGHVRFIGEASERITEDALRILRFFRFFATHGHGQADAIALAACTQHRTALNTLSGERIQQEMGKLLCAADPLAALQYMHSAAILATLLRSGAINWDILRHAIATGPVDPVLRLALLMRQPCGVSIDYIIDRWKLSGKDQKKLALLLCHERLIWPTTPTDMIRTARHLPDGFYPLLLARDAAETSRDTTETAALVQQAASLALPVFPVTGADLIAHGIKPGPDMGAALKKLEDVWEHSDFKPGKNELLDHLN